MAKLYWEPLQPGDIVDIVAPASDCSEYELNCARRFVEKFGLIPRVPKNIFGKNELFCSNTDAKRFQFLKRALNARDSKAIWSLRGGYGCSRLLPHLSRMRPPEKVKLFLGYSDNTILHQFFNDEWNWPSIHSSVLVELGKGQGSRTEINDLRRIIFGLSDKITYRSLQPMNALAKKNRSIRSTVVGGNLTVMVSTLGTPWSPVGKGRILMLEDIGERGYRVDRMLVQLQQAGYFKGLRALIFGDFVGGDEGDCVYLWKDVQRLFARNAKFPVFKGLPCGHTTMQRPLPLNTRAELMMGRTPALTVYAGTRFTRRS